ncbi:hypothetical protein LEN26_006421 [Aphanomyces euteiches]|nr:hypothetical protein LEN26_006421 [Aphanomyces euteiches]
MSGPRHATAGLVLRRTRSQEFEYASGVTLPLAAPSVAPPFAAYPPDITSVQQLGQQVQQAVEAQSTRLDSVQQAVGAQQEYTYEQLMALHQKQQEQYAQQMQMNDRLVAQLADQRNHQQTLVEQLMAQKKVTEAHEQGLHMAAEFSVKHAQQLEEMRRRTSARWHAFSAAPPEVPKAPTFNGSTKVQMRRFMDQYEAYSREISLANAQRPGGAQIHQVPLSACIDPLAVERIAFWEMGKPSRELTEDDWRMYFLSAKDCGPADMTKLDSAMTKLKMDVSIQSAESRVSKLVSDFEAVLVRLSMEGFAEAETKLTVEYLVAVIQPPIVRGRVKELLKLHENRGLKKDARVFKTWLSEYMRRYGEFEPLFSAQKPAGEKSQNAKPAKGDKKAKMVAVVNVDKIPVSNFLQDKRICFKCLSPEYHVFKCPRVVEGEAKLLMDRARAVWKEMAAKAPNNEAPKAKAVTVVERQSPVEVSVTSAVACAARVVCLASDVVALDASFDSGADQSVVPPTTLKKLTKHGREVPVVKLRTPVLVKGFNGPTYSVIEEAVLDLIFNTEASPLLLRNVKCWVSGDDLPAGVGEILLSRAIMYKLGYDPRSMLRDAALVADQYDMADVTSPSGVVTAVMLACNELVDDLAAEEEQLLPLELDTCFPDLKVDVQDETAKVQDDLDAKIEEAVRFACGPDFAARLKSLLDRYRDVFRLSLGRDPPVSMPLSKSISKTVISPSAARLAVILSLNESLWRNM